MSKRTFAGLRKGFFLSESRAPITKWQAKAQTRSPLPVSQTRLPPVPPMPDFEDAETRVIQPVEDWTQIRNPPLVQMPFMRAATENWDHDLPQGTRVYECGFRFTGRGVQVNVYRSTPSNNPLTTEVNVLMHLPSMIELRHMMRVRFVVLNEDQMPARYTRMDMMSTEEVITGHVISGHLPATEQ
jgi:hypothetical protein